MNTLFKGIAIALLAIASTASAFAEGSLIVNSENPVGADAAKLGPLLVGKNKFWDNGEAVVIAVLKDSPDAETLLNTYAQMDESRFKSHWQRLAFSGRGTMPKQFSDPAELVAFVRANKGAIGILGAGADLSSVKKIN